MNRSKLIVIVVAGVVLAAAAVVLSSGGAPAPGLVGSAEVRQLQDAGARVVDVRTAAEFAGAHIAGAENVPEFEIASAAAGWDRTQPVVVYCAVGSRSAGAAALLESLGFEAVYDLEGGIAQWDGELAGGSAPAPDAPQVALNGLPVMYEFYTDW